MTNLEKAVALMIDVFHHYEAKSDKGSLTKEELKTLVEKELPGFLSSAKEKVGSEELLKVLDENDDKELDLKNFFVFLASLATLGSENVPPK